MLTLCRSKQNCTVCLNYILDQAVMCNQIFTKEVMNLNSSLSLKSYKLFFHTVMALADLNLHCLISTHSFWYLSFVFLDQIIPSMNQLYRDLSIGLDIYGATSCLDQYNMDPKDNRNKRKGHGIG